VFDGQAGLHQNGYRDYDPAIGRYAESDPMGLAGGSLSPYDYVRSNPVFLIDPTGLADLNLFDPNPQGRDASGTYAGGNNWNIPGVYTVAGHENPGNMEDDRNGTWNYTPLFPNNLAKLIQSDPNWNHKPVMLGACNTGRSWENGYLGRGKWEPFAQTLANLLGVPVTAPLGFTRYNAQRGVLGSTETARGPVSGPGQWKTFFPAN
jgi:RHS repeat-associated protein